MNDLEVLESLYPEGEPMTPVERSSMRADLFGETPALDADDAPHRRTPRRAVSIAATLLVACGSAGIWFTMDRPTDPGPFETPPAADVATTTAPTTTVPLVIDVAGTTAPVPPLTASPEAQPTEPPTQVSGSEILFELADRVSATIDLAFDAIDAATQDCLQAQGAETVATPTYLLLAPRVTPEDLPWNVPNDSPSTNGYAKPPDRVFTEVSGPPDGSEAFANLYGNVVGTWYTDDPSPPLGSSVEGPIYDGCFPVAQTQIVGGGDPSDSYALTDAALRLDIAKISFINEVTANPQYQSAIADWAACMAQKGIDATDPAALAGRNWARPQPTADEIAMAVADSDCRSTSRLFETGNRLFNDRAEVWFAENPDAENEIRQVVLQVSARIAQLRSSP